MSSKFDATVAFGGNQNDEKGYNLYRDTWFNNGWNIPQERKCTLREMTDSLAVSNMRSWLPQVVSEVVREPVEPLTVLSSLLDRIAWTPGISLTFPAIGAMTAADIPEGGAYPETSLNIAPGTAIASVGKSGVSFKITEEMRDSSQFDLVNLHLRAARRALDRHKEKKGMDWILGMGVSLFDNKAPATSIFGVCTGRSITGAANGSCRMEDLLKAYSHIMMQGYVPNTLLMHPFAWSMWMHDPLLQTIVKNTGNGSWFQPHSMSKTSSPWAASSLGKRGIPGNGGTAFVPGGNAASATATALSATDPSINSAAKVPGYFPYPLNVIVSPFVPFDVNNSTSSIFIFDSSNLGAMLVNYDVQLDQWEDLSVDITKFKLKESYGFNIYEDGLAVGLLLNVPTKANEIALPMSATISAAGSIAEIPAGTAISGL